jgi:hypothetical protein
MRVNSVGKIRSADGGRSFDRDAAGMDGAVAASHGPDDEAALDNVSINEITFAC